MYYLSHGLLLKMADKLNLKSKKKRLESTHSTALSGFIFSSICPFWSHPNLWFTVDLLRRVQHWHIGSWADTVPCCHVVLKPTRLHCHGRVWGFSFQPNCTAADFQPNRREPISEFSLYTVCLEGKPAYSSMVEGWRAVIHNAQWKDSVVKLIEL